MATLTDYILISSGFVIGQNILNHKSSSFLVFDSRAPWEADPSTGPATGLVLFELSQFPLVSYESLKNTQLLFQYPSINIETVDILHSKSDC